MTQFFKSCGNLKSCPQYQDWATKPLAIELGLLVDHRVSSHCVKHPCIVGECCVGLWLVCCFVVAPTLRVQCSPFKGSPAWMIQDYTGRQLVPFQWLSTLLSVMLEERGSCGTSWAVSVASLCPPDGAQHSGQISGWRFNLTCCPAAVWFQLQDLLKMWGEGFQSDLSVFIWKPTPVRLETELLADFFKFFFFIEANWKNLE